MDSSTPSNTVELEPRPPLKQLPPTSAPPPPSPPARRRSLWIWFAAAVAILCIAALILWPRIKGALPGEPKPPEGGGRGGRGGGGPTPVVATRATKGDIQVYYSGLGAVTPIYTVTVKSRVDGQLMKVQFKEGQTGSQGRPAGRDRSAALSGAARSRPKGS